MKYLTLFYDGRQEVLAKYSMRAVRAITALTGADSLRRIARPVKVTMAGNMETA
jgi:hypothetical protein